ncbi:MAG: aldehyde dehydrogenase family protein [Thermocrispum sp.]
MPPRLACLAACSTSCPASAPRQAPRAGGVELPFGGWKRCGYGREKGFEGLLGYTQTKTVAIGMG